MNGSFIPWSLPAAAGLILGIALRLGGVPWWLLATLLPAILLPVTLLPAALVGRRRSWYLLMLFLTLGYARYAYWEAVPNPLTPLFGDTVTVTGTGDGHFLTLEDPRGVRVAISPAGALPPGRATVTGELSEPPGKRNPGGFDYRGYLKRRGVLGQLFVTEIGAVTPRRSVKELFARGVSRGLSPKSAALMQAMTLGIRDDLGDLRNVFAASGVAHILALSGLHVGVLMLAVSWLLRGLGRRRYPLMIIITVLFVALVGATPSILRAGVMVVVALFSLWHGAGRIEPWPAMGLAACLTLLWNPSWLFELSFQLSYLAVGGLLLFTGPLTRLLLGSVPAPLPWWDWRALLLGTAVASTAAQALTLPLVASQFGAIPLLSPLVNVVAVPLATLLVPLGFLAALLGLLWPPLAGLVNLVTSGLAGGLIFIVERSAALPSLVWGEVSLSGYLYYGAGIAAVLLVIRGILRPWRGLVVLAIAMLCSSVTPSPHPPPEIVFLDVGQGDSALVRLPGRREILIDGGGSLFSDFDVGGRTVVPALRALGVDELELVIATHADTDHIEGLQTVLDRLPVGELVIGVPDPGKAVFDDLIAVAARRGVPVRRVRRGETLVVGQARLEILNPPLRAYPGTNDNSVVSVLWYGGRPRALFLGDASTKIDGDLAIPDVDILMVAHHGSAGSTSSRLLAAAQPEVAVISTGRNSFGHPHPALLARLEERGIAIRITRREGAIRLDLRLPFGGGGRELPREGKQTSL